ncbi:MAG: hypothetical protein PsegKO_20850 [Pseudohongiellaceae bacterium]
MIFSAFYNYGKWVKGTAMRHRLGKDFSGYKRTLPDGRYSGVLARIVFAWSILALPSAVLGGAIVEVRTSVGSFYIELNERAAPISSANFLNYVTLGRYDETFVYGASDGSLVRGGGYTFASCPDGVLRIIEEPPIAFEKTGLSNQRGTISMVPSSRSSDSATSDWIINLEDNLAFDRASTGYAPFGKVVGDGLATVEAIAFSNPAVYSDPLDNQGGDYFNYPINCQLPGQSNHISVAFTLVNADADMPSGRYSSDLNDLEVNILLPGDSYIRMPFDVVMHDNGETTISPKFEESIALEHPTPNMARYDASASELTLPSLDIDGVVLFEDVRFVQTEDNSSTFRLVSFAAL